MCVVRILRARIHAHTQRETQAAARECDTIALGPADTRKEKRKKELHDIELYAYV